MNISILNQVFFGNSVKAYLLFAGILIFGLIFKRIFSRLLSKLLYKVFGRFGESLHPQVFVALLIRPIELLILFVTLFLAINQLNFPLNEILFSRQIIADGNKLRYTITVIDVVDKLFILSIIVSVFWILLRLVDFTGKVYQQKAALTDSKSDDQIIPFVKELTKVIVVVFGIFFILGGVFNLNVATIIAGLGIGGIAVALAAKESLENLFGSFTIFMDRPFIVGDLIKVESIEGTVERVGFRSTRIRTMDKTIVILPNKKMIDGALENMTMRNFRRMRFNIGLLYETSPELLKKISQEITEAIDAHEQTSPDTLVVFESFGDSSLNLLVLYYIQVVDYTPYMIIREEINYMVMDIVAKNGAGFAYPTQTLYITEQGARNKEQGIR